MRHIAVSLQGTVWCVNQHSNIRFNTCHKFIDSHFNRLREGEQCTRDIVVQYNTHLIKEVFTRLVFGPIGLGLEQHPDIGLLNTHDVIGNLGTTCLTEDSTDFREFQQ